MPDPAGPDGASSATPPPPTDEPPAAAAARSSARRRVGRDSRHDSRPPGHTGPKPNARRSCTAAPTRGGAGYCGSSWSRALLAGVLIGGYFRGRRCSPTTSIATASRRQGSTAPTCCRRRTTSSTDPRWAGSSGDITVDHGSDTFRFTGAADTDLAGLEIVGDAAGRLALRHGGWTVGSGAGPTHVRSNSSRSRGTSTSSTPTMSSRRRGATATCRSTTARPTFLSQESKRRRCTRSCSTPRATRPTTRSSGTSGWRRCSRSQRRRRHAASRCGSTTTA